MTSNPLQVGQPVQFFHDKPAMARPLAAIVTAVNEDGTVAVAFFAGEAAAVQHVKRVLVEDNGTPNTCRALPSL